MGYFSFFIIALTFLIMLFTFLKKRKRETHKKFLLLLLLFFFWSISWFLLHHIREEESVRIWMNIWQTTTMFLPYAIFSFILSFLQNTFILNRILSLILLLLGGVSCVCIWTQKFYANTLEIGGCLYPASTQWSDSFSIFFVALGLYSLYLLWQRYTLVKRTDEAQQLKCLLLSLIFAGLGWIGMVLISHSILHFPVSYTFFLLSLFCILYSIFKHKLLQIHVVIRRSMVYTTLTIAITTIFLCTLLLFEKLFRKWAGYQSFFPTIIAATAIATLFEPLYKRTQYIIDRAFFRARTLREKRLQEFIKEVSSIYEREKLFSSIIECLFYVVPVEYAYLLLLDEEQKMYKVVHAKGVGKHGIETICINAERVLPRYLGSYKKELLLDEIEEASALVEVRKELKKDMESLGAHFVAPILYKDTLIAFICCGPKKHAEFYNEDDIYFLSLLCTESGMAIENVRLYEETVHHFMHTVEALTHAVEAKDPYTFGHSKRVAEYASWVARRFGLGGETVEAIRRGGALHDIGKIGIEEKILLKPGRLNEEEFEQIKMHPIIGVKILSPIKFPKETIDAVKYHHERMDGSGYPEGIKGDQIPLSAKILAVCDAFEAMTSDRPYRKALSSSEAEEEIKRAMGKWFDAQIVKTFLEVIKEKRHEEMF